MTNMGPERSIEALQSDGLHSAAVAGAATAGAGAALVATMATACCVPVAGPLIVAVLGASGASWASGLKPYSPYLLAGSLVLLAFGFWSVYRPRRSCSLESRPSRGHLAARLTLWLALAVWSASLALNVVLD